MTEFSAEFSEARYQEDLAACRRLLEDLKLAQHRARVASERDGGIDPGYASSLVVSVVDLETGTVTLVSAEPGVCRCCGSKRTGSPKSWRENPFCSACLHERVAKNMGPITVIDDGDGYVRIVRERIGDGQG